MDGYFDGTLGSDPVRQNRPHHGLDLSILDGAVIHRKAEHAHALVPIGRYGDARREGEPVTVYGLAA